MKIMKQSPYEVVYSKLLKQGVQEAEARQRAFEARNVRDVGESPVPASVGVMPDQKIAKPKKVKAGK